MPRPNIGPCVAAERITELVPVADRTFLYRARNEFLAREHAATADALPQAQQWELARLIAHEAVTALQEAHERDGRD